jgi:hypothetical protein
LDSLTKTRELILQISNADNEKLHRLIIQFQDQLLLYRLMLELAKAKRDNNHEYHDYLIDFYYTRRFPHKLSVDDIDFNNNEDNPQLI